MDVEGSWIRPAVVGNPEDEGSWGHWRRATKRKVKKRRFDAANLSSGIYFYEIRTANFNSVKKMTLVR